MRGAQRSARCSRCSVASTTSVGMPSSLATTLFEPPGRQVSAVRVPASPLAASLTVPSPPNATHDVVALGGGLAAELDRVALGLGLARRHVVAALERVDDEALDPVGHLRRDRVDDHEHALRRSAPRAPRPPRGRSQPSAPAEEGGHADHDREHHRDDDPEGVRRRPRTAGARSCRTSSRSASAAGRSARSRSGRGRSRWCGARSPTRSWPRGPRRPPCSSRACPSARSERVDEVVEVDVEVLGDVARLVALEVAERERAAAGRSCGS